MMGIAEPTENNLHTTVCAKNYESCGSGASPNLGETCPPKNKARLSQIRSIPRS